MWLWIGIVFGLAFNIRYQTSLFTFGIGLTLLIYKKWKEAAILSVGFLIAVAIFQGGIDYLVWKQPFIQLQTYFTYNMTHAGEYPMGSWYHYLPFLLLVLIPPVSFFLFIGYFRTYRKLLIIFLPVLIFFVFHSIYPNKQERFITTIVPFIMISGVIGWQITVDGLFNPALIKKWIKASWVFFWIINFIFFLYYSFFPCHQSYASRIRRFCNAIFSF